MHGVGGPTTAHAAIFREETCRLGFRSRSPARWVFISMMQIAPATAQSQSQSAQSASAGLEEIVVTARRREEKLQSVPIAITAFAPKDLEEKHIESASDLQHYVPALATSQETRDEQVFYLRGQGPNGGQGGSPGVVTYFAEVPFNGSGPGIYFDLDNLQVLRGPQGTLFGRNTNRRRRPIRAETADKYVRRLCRSVVRRLQPAWRGRRDQYPDHRRQAAGPRRLQHQSARRLHPRRDDGPRSG